MAKKVVKKTVTKKSAAKPKVAKKAASKTKKAVKPAAKPKLVKEKKAVNLILLCWPILPYLLEISFP